MNRRSFMSRYTRYAAALPFLGMAAASPQAQPIEGELLVLESEALPLVSYGPATINGVLVEGEEGLEYVLTLGNAQIAQGPAAQIVARADQLVHAIYGR